MSILKNLLLTVACLAGLAALIGLALPSTWEVARTVQIQGDIFRCHEVVGDLKTWKDWSLWGQGADPHVRIETGLTSRGPGATLDWSGPEVGAGKLTVLTEGRREGLTFDVALRGGRERALGEVRYQDVNGSSTSVTLKMRGDVGSDLIGRYQILFRTYTIGPDVVDALTRLKRRIETGY